MLDDHRRMAIAISVVPGRDGNPRQYDGQQVRDMPNTCSRFADRNPIVLDVGCLMAHVPSFPIIVPRVACRILGR